MFEAYKTPPKLSMFHWCCDRVLFIINPPLYAMYSTSLLIALVSRQLFCTIIRQHLHITAHTHTRTHTLYIRLRLRIQVVFQPDSHFIYWILCLCLERFLSSDYLLQCLHTREIRTRLSLPQGQDFEIQKWAPATVLMLIQIPFMCHDLSSYRELFLVFHAFQQRGGEKVEEKDSLSWSWRQRMMEKKGGNQEVETVKGPSGRRSKSVGGREGMVLMCIWVTKSMGIRFLKGREGGIYRYQWRQMHQWQAQCWERRRGKIWE